MWGLWSKSVDKKSGLAAPGCLTVSLSNRGLRAKGFVRKSTP